MEITPCFRMSASSQSIGPDSSISNSTSIRVGSESDDLVSEPLSNSMLLIILVAFSGSMICKPKNAINGPMRRRCSPGSRSLVSSNPDK